jgi:hypothetical protein
LQDGWDDRAACRKLQSGRTNTSPDIIQSH